MTNFSDTICAIATPHGVGAQSTIKISGDKALEIVGCLFRPAKMGISLVDTAPYSSLYGWLYDPKDSSVIDDCIVLVMRAPHSYTGEDQLEITCHGNPFISKIILEALIASGARLAEPGEFTRRAFANGKLDLSQAEAVADVIASTNRAALRLSLTQMKGLFHKKISELRAQLIRIASLIEVELDFSEEDLEFVPREELLADCQAMIQEVEHLADSFSKSEVIKNGIPIAIVGATNAGKSTLLNGLLKEERAIVSDIHGTTRDTIEDTLYIEGQQFRLIDTAGLRKTTDTIEHIGIGRALQKAASAELVLWLLDASDTPGCWNETLTALGREVEGNRIQPIINKIDVVQSGQVAKARIWLEEQGLSHPVEISARSEQGVETIKRLLHDRFSNLEVADNQLMVINIRQATALRSAADALHTVTNGIQLGLSGDLLAQDLRSATAHLGEVIGEVTTDDLLSSIFENFCIGK
ncbi:MAG: tRNA uridine-5-carboxymethylaminomethyl(34) synthesis GTPase MnmE [Bacteroidales bacterium]|uniref:tRNA uridine-5-carboxymethylaminomethyl(34) synthesis GTPase MnmE n=1 Tax=Porphyromonas sp. TaxID=1924944 RepID=UPI0029719E10|nr:tRNA uridine-5-carboxymethylaminomethyl(34) synthesis GTPase MnmE [Porphyromonas sp.]MDD7438181.1 tRNA uridine-5-carboxymethylaminomethyl(34) synthesis GTPase MnmE [Bacteroidales bacterium]MDY3066828.1 tRNA uridine-5-carboxymethylaminomethyl(34) synthesis GTPase MnmE [Porphyromonas sp.]